MSDSHPPTLFVVLALPFWKVAHTILYFNWYAGLLGYCGGVAGYVMYDMTHYFLHHRKSVKIMIAISLNHMLKL